MTQPYNPYSPPVSQPVASGDDATHLRAVARYQKNVLLCILANVGNIVLAMALPKALMAVVVLGSLAVWVASVVCIVFLAKTVYNLAFAIFCALCSFVPLLGLVMLVVVNGRATRILRKAGLKVGLLGVDLVKLG